MSSRLKVALLVESDSALGRAIQRGVAAYARLHGPWAFYHQIRSMGDRAPASLKDWGCHGVLARIESPGLLAELRWLRLPTVDLLRLHDLEDMPSVSVDHAAAARAAVAELRSRGLTHFGFCGFPGLGPSDQRCGHFVGLLREAGFAARVYGRQRARRGARIFRTLNQGLLDEDHLARWLLELPKPVGIMAPNDVLAHQVLNACSKAGIAVPEEAAVIGVDNDEVLCELSDPPLSSVDLNGQRIGYEAAALLEHMIQGPPGPARHILVQPAGVVVRQSTDVLAIGDPIVARAMHFIRLHACTGIGVEDVLRHVSVARRTLERRFEKALKRCPGEEIARVRLRRVQELLAATDFPLAKIARLAGFQYVESMCYFFREQTGQTPGAYRRETGAALRSLATG